MSRTLTEFISQHAVGTDAKISHGRTRHLGASGLWLWYRKHRLSKIMGKSSFLIFKTVSRTIQECSQLILTLPRGNARAGRLMLRRWDLLKGDFIPSRISTGWKHWAKRNAVYAYQPTSTSWNISVGTLSININIQKSRLYMTVSSTTKSIQRCNDKDAVKTNRE